MFPTTTVDTRMCHLLHSDFDTRTKITHPLWPSLIPLACVLPSTRASPPSLSFSVPLRRASLSLSLSPFTVPFTASILLTDRIPSLRSPAPFPSPPLSSPYTCSFCSHSLVPRLPLSFALLSSLLSAPAAAVLLILGHTPTVLERIAPSSSRQRGQLSSGRLTLPLRRFASNLSLSLFFLPRVSVTLYFGGVLRFFFFSSPPPLLLSPFSLFHFAFSIPHLSLVFFLHFSSLSLWEARSFEDC